MTRRRPTPHRRPSLDLTPTTLARTIDTLDRSQLEDYANAILGRFTLTAEAPGMRIAQDTLAHAKPGGSEPRSVPMCECGCPSQRDHWERRFNAAVSLDAQWSHDNNAPLLFKRFRMAIYNASMALDRAHRSPSRVTELAEVELPHERDEWIVGAYEDVGPEIASAHETLRSGFCSPAAIRATRKRNDRHPETGRPVVPRTRPEVLANARSMRAAGLSQNRIAMELGVAQSTVSRMLQDGNEEEAA